jgi:hypothetical protein
MLHYVQRISKLAGSNGFALAGINYSSSVAALQVLALAWNCGHLPGTFAVEKGVYRYLAETDSEAPANALIVPHAKDAPVKAFTAHANDFLLEQDFIGLSRVLAAIKLLEMAPDSNGLTYRVALGLYWPVVAGREPEPSPRWARLRSLFKAIRHAAYLTLDCPFTGIQWLPQIPGLVDQLKERVEGDTDEFVSVLCEVLSPVERIASQTIYHSLAARRNTAWVAECVRTRLLASGNAPAEIERWSHLGVLGHLRLNMTNAEVLNHVGGVQLRSFFSSDDVSIVATEAKLVSLGFSHVNVSRYLAWNSEKLLEPDETIADVFMSRPVTGSDVGRFLAWLIGRYEQLSDDSDDLDYESLMRRDLVASYRQLLERAIALVIPRTSLRLEPWDLGALGVLRIREEWQSGGGIWAADRALEDAHTRRLMRRRKNVELPAQWEFQAAELEGLRRLRTWTNARWKGRIPRKRWLLVPAGVRLVRENRDLIEFDGGLVEISMRSGRMAWWGLETKRGAENPIRSLRRRLGVLGVTADFFRLSARHAVCRVNIG